MDQNTMSYIICATPRSGSTLLCDLLANTAMSGKPDSYFMQKFVPWWANEFKLSSTNWNNQHEFDLAYISSVQNAGKGGTEVFGMRLMWESVEYLFSNLRAIFPHLENENTLLQKAFGSVTYIYLTRENKIAQAVSRLKAEQSGLWHLHADGTERERLKPEQTPAYDSQLLSKYLKMIEDNDQGWQEWFSQKNIIPINVSYEALSNKPSTELKKILMVLGLDHTKAQYVQPRTKKLATPDSLEWEKRFQDEMKL